MSAQAEAAWQDYRKKNTIPGYDKPSREDFMFGWAAALAEFDVPTGQMETTEGRATVMALGDYLYEHYPTAEPDIAKAALIVIKALEATPTTAPAGVDRETLAKWLVDMGATRTLEHGFEQVEWVNAPLDVVLDQVALVEAGPKEKSK